ncbi:MAG: helicase, partial [Oscillospiraceae bacterium]
MLRFIKGGSGFGKSTFIQQEIVRLSENTEREILLLVPEQFSFEAEREYYGILGAEKAGRVKVLSFMRLADEVFREYGGMAGDYASQTSKILTMRLALKECRTELRLYGKNALRPDFVLFMIDAVEEMKNAGVSPQQLEENALVTENAVLKDKLFDFSLIYGSYDAILAQDFLDTSDSLERMKEKIVDHQYFEGKLIFVDEFKSFTAVQKEVLRLGFMQSEQVTISLCMSDIRMEYGLFDGIRETENQLKSLSFQIGCKVLPPMIFEKPQRFS